MIIWRGWGILVPVVALGIWILLPMLFKGVMPAETFTQFYKYISISSMLISAAAVWFIGRRLNGGDGRMLMDEATGEQVVLKSNHSLFFINFEYWAIPVVILGVIVLFG